MMRIHLLSDLHNEFRPFTPQVLDVDVVILAGDIDVNVRGVAWARQCFSGPVLYVPGNHEYYGGHLGRTLQKMRLVGGERVRVLDRDEVIIAGVRFLGATMWTDFAATGNPPMASLSAQHAMNDFRQIRTENYRRIRPADLVEQSVKTRDWLCGKLAESFAGQTVVITHHAPSLRSLQDSPHAGTHMDAAYANRWEDLMGGEALALWLHGHCHSAADYDVAGTRVVCNPRGYPGEKTGFNPGLILTL
jgi:3',5'-cyclic AMP phosphodiesterase CpdA